MKDINFKPLAMLFKQVWQELYRLGSLGIEAIGAMSWPALLACAIGCAFLLAILPLALTLFVIFLLIKWATATVVIANVRTKSKTEQEQAQ
ncbi:hypothetical protein [Janthinobacterium agaricidamnosum]|uniref:Transmembrane protein n=1 Tax=Janthinobacterium agaricidamnosum NBRC 102515 = DSM 9628 TaxID=1349767 RepID=W0V874_9BURK|nr:hypothetical protein [Janthinobacterium agaricidamnosum]CDG85014.1 hypothetical protein GJA_4407 [Janthinobacterium agaricidamnosum NBRC 102515 = DSM 9628]